jgi:mono/diheme cytochrome c family protein
MRSSPVSLLALAFAALATGPALVAADVFPEAERLAFTDRHCSSCHNDVDKEGGLDLTALTYQPSDPANFQAWVKVHDRVQSGEMPPKEKKRPTDAEISGFIKGLATSLTSTETQLTARDGRATQRRLNRAEYENTIRDLLQLPWLQIKDQLPEDGEAHRYNKIGDALEVSYVQMARYMSAARYAITEALKAQLLRPAVTTKRYYAREQGGLTGRFNGADGGNSFTDRSTVPLINFESEEEVRARRQPATVGAADPEKRELEAVGWVHGNYPAAMTTGFTSYRAPVAGKYRIKFSGYTFWAGPYGHLQPFNNNRVVGHPPAIRWVEPNYGDISQGRANEPITISTQGSQVNRRLGWFDLTPAPMVHDLGEVELYANDTIIVDASRFFRSRPTVTRGIWTNPLAQRDGMPGVAFRWMEVEGPLPDPATGAGYKLLFGDMALKKVGDSDPGVKVPGAIPLPESPFGAGGRGGRGRGAGPAMPDPKYEVVSANPEQDAERLLRSFMQRAFRTPVDDERVKRYLGLFKTHYAEGKGFAEAMVTAYTGVLSSPGFVFVQENPGRLDDHALATRLALFLWNSEPDEALRAKAAKGQLRQPEALRAETERMLNDPKSRRFIDAFTDYWLDLRKMEETTPSVTLYNDYYLDDMLMDSAMDETRLFVRELVDKNLPVRNIINSDFAFLNEHLALHYGIPNVEGVSMRKVKLPADSVRGGLITQASILKITANGTTTSPVLRGVWVTERIMGHPIPPPPAAVPAVEPDTRGATTIRQQIEKHRADESCAVCHRKLDPPGFALESFDVMGGWRDRYRAADPAVAPELGFGRNGHPFMFHYALEVDPSGQLFDGRPFRDVREFKKLLMNDEAQIARNLARQLTVFATGAPIRFSDRDKVEEIVRSVKPQDYGLRSIIHGVVQSDLFRNK